MIVLETVRAECGSGMSQCYAGWWIVFQKAISAAYGRWGCAKLSAACRDERRTSTATDFRAYMA